MYYDGINCINCYSKGETGLGFLLSNFVKVPMNLPEGHFDSVEGYYHYLLLPTNEEREIMKTLSGSDAIKIGRELKAKFGKTYPDDFYQKLLTAIWYKFYLNREVLFREESYKTLPLVHYYIMYDKVIDKTKGEYTQWYINGLEVMRNLLVCEDFINTMLKGLSTKYEYRKIPEEYSRLYQDIYRTYVPKHLENKSMLYTHTGTLITNSYERIVVGDYGAFIEFIDENANKQAFKVESGQEYRITDENYRNRVKYFWYTIPDNSGIKIYYQQRRVDYADYIPGRYYVSVFDVNPFLG